MSLFGGVVSVTGIGFLMLCVLAVAAVGYALGRITIKGVSLGTAGVFIVALVFGALFYKYIDVQLLSKVTAEAGGESVTKSVSYAGNALKIVENLGLILFVTAVGFIAGPNFFKNLKKNFKSYILLGVVIVLAGALTCAGCFFIGRGAESDPKEFVAMLVGILSGSLTSTPAFSAAKATVLPEYESAVTVGHGIAYLFGVIGVVLFVQLIPKLSRADMEHERSLLHGAGTDGEGTEGNKAPDKLFSLDKFGIGVFALAAALGVVIGAIKIPLSGKGLSGTTFSLTTTGGALIVSLLFGHFRRIGRLNITPDKKTLEVFRETGLMLFLIGAGIAGGAKFVEYFKAVYFLYGVAMTVIPMIIGFVFAKFVLKLSLLNNLGSITGGMTSTPALGTLINVAGTDDVASAYAATYPIALIAVVLASQFLILLL
ncbi:MAG: permease [Clostridia bacterium]|nr:permease [Clostridia bacterium]